jgi:hypothetical protein
MVINRLFFDMCVKSKFKLSELRCTRPVNFPLSKSYTYSYVFPLHINSSSQMFIIAYHDEIISHICEEKFQQYFTWTFKLELEKGKRYDMIWGGEGLFLNCLWKTCNTIKSIEQCWTNLVPYQVYDGTHYYNDFKWFKICVF